MRPDLSAALAVLTLAAALAGCGGSSSPASSTVGSAPSGTVLGARFTPADSAAVALAPAACVLSGQSVGLSALVLGFSSLPGLCGRASTACTQEKAGEALLSLSVLKAGLSAQAPVGPGTYLVTDAPSADANGNLAFVAASLQRRDASCGDATGGVTVSRGSVTITSVDASRARGSVAVALSDGGSFDGAFDVPLCTGVALDACSVATSCGTTPACVP